MHPDRMHLHHRMLRIGHSVQGAVLILWGWAAMISFGSIMILFFRVLYVVIGMIVASVILAVFTMLPYVLRRLPEFEASHAAGRAPEHARSSGLGRDARDTGDSANAMNAAADSSSTDSASVNSAAARTATAKAGSDAARLTESEPGIRAETHEPSDADAKYVPTPHNPSQHDPSVRA